MITRPLFVVADGDNATPAAHHQGELQVDGERMCSMSSLETQYLYCSPQLSHQQGLFALVVVETQKKKERKEWSPLVVYVGVAPGAGVYHSGATSRTVGRTGGDAQGFGVSGMRVWSGVL